MKRTDIKTDTVYTIKESSYGRPDRGVVLSNEPHLLTAEVGKPFELRPDDTKLYKTYGHVGSKWGRRVILRGLPVLVVSAYRNEVTNEQLLTLAKERNPTGDSITLHRDSTTVADGVRIEILRPQDVGRTWDDYLIAEDEAEKARQRAELAKKQRLAEINDAKAAVYGLLHGLDLSVELRGGRNYEGLPEVARMSWQDMYSLLTAVSDAAYRRGTKARN